VKILLNNKLNMGACCDLIMPLDQEVKDILKILDDKYEDLIKTFLIEEKKQKINKKSN
jgi:hypothetical protein